MICVVIVMHGNSVAHVKTAKRNEKQNKMGKERTKRNKERVRGMLY